MSGRNPGNDRKSKRQKLMEEEKASDNLDLFFSLPMELQLQVAENFNSMEAYALLKSERSNNISIAVRHRLALMAERFQYNVDQFRRLLNRDGREYKIDWHEINDEDQAYDEDDDETRRLPPIYPRDYIRNARFLDLPIYSPGRMLDFPSIHYQPRSQIDASIHYRPGRYIDLDALVYTHERGERIQLPLREVHRRTREALVARTTEERGWFNIIRRRAGEEEFKTNDEFTSFMTGISELPAIERHNEMMRYHRFSIPAPGVNRAEPPQRENPEFDRSYERPNQNMRSQ